MSKFNEVEARRALIKFVEEIARRLVPDSALRAATVAMFGGMLVLYRDAVRRELTGTPAEHHSAQQTEARITELERQLGDAEKDAARFQAAWHSARMRAQCEASHSRVCRISRGGWRRRAKQAEAALDRVRALADVWQASVRPGEPHPGAAAIRAALEDHAAPARPERTHPMTLDDLIDTLSLADQSLVLLRGFDSPHASRVRTVGPALGFEPATGITLGAMLAAARSAQGVAFTDGYDEFTATGDTPCWLDFKGMAFGLEITPELLADYITAGAVPPRGTEDHPLSTT